MIDDKLAEIAEEHEVYDPRGTFVDKVKQAFADEGYVNRTEEQLQSEHEHMSKVLREADLMTGQEFYERFEKELGEPAWGLKAAYPREAVLEAARKAAGL